VTQMIVLNSAPKSIHRYRCTVRLRTGIMLACRLRLAAVSLPLSVTGCYCVPQHLRTEVETATAQYIGDCGGLSPVQTQRIQCKGVYHVSHFMPH